MKRAGLHVLILSISLVFGCNEKAEPARGNLEENLVISEKSLPDTFEQMATEYDNQKFVIVRVSNAEDYQEMWRQFQIKEEIVDVNTEKKDVLFVGLFESSSCPYDISDLVANTEKHELEVYFAPINGNCTADSSPRNFVLSIDKVVSEELSTLVLVDHSKRILVPISDM